MMLFKKFFIGVLLFGVFANSLSAKGLDCSERFAPIGVSDIVTFVPFVSNECRVADAIEKMARYADSGGQTSAPTVDDYKTIGISGVDSYNVRTINSGLTSITGSYVHSSSKFVAFVNQIILNNPRPYNVGKFDGVKGVSYKTSSGLSGVTGEDGEFRYRDGDEITFSISNAELGKVQADRNIEIFDFKNALLVSQLLHSLDNDTDATNGFNLSNVKNRKMLKSNKKYTLDINEVDPYNDQYKIFLKQHSKHIVPSSKSVAIDFLEKVKKTMAQNPRTRPEYSGAVNIMKGKWSFPFANNDTIKFYAEKKYREEKYLYRIKLAAMYRVYLENIQEIAAASKGKIDEAEELAERAKKFENKMQFALAEAIDTIDAIDKMKDGKVKKGLKELAINTGKNSLNYAIESTGSAYTPEMKFTTTLLVEGLTAESKSDAINITADIASSSLEMLVRDTLAEEYPVGAETVKSLGTLAINLAKIYATCSPAMRKSSPAACLKNVSSEFLKQSLTVFNTSFQIYSLGEGQEEINSARVALEMYQAKQYTENNYCMMLQSYDHSASDADCGNVEKLSTDKEASFNKLAEAVANSGDIAISDTFFGDIDYEKVKDFYMKLINRSAIVQQIYGKNFSKLKGNGGYIDSRVANTLVLSDIKRKLDVVWDLNVDNSANFKACINIDSKDAITLYTPQISLYDDKGVHVFELDDFEQNFRGVKSVCGKLETYKPYRYSIKQDTANGFTGDYPFLIVADGGFRFITDTSKNYDFKLSQLYSFTARRASEKSSVSVNYTMENDYTYHLNAELVDNRVESKDVTQYNYNWDIRIPNCSKQDLGDVVVGKSDYLAYIPEGCRNSTPKYTLTVYDGQNEVASSSHTMEPYMVDDTEELYISAPAIINIDNKKWFTPLVKPSGGVPPYDITFEAYDNSIFVLKNPTTGTSRLKSQNNSPEEKRVTINVSVDDNASNHATQSITIVIGKNQTLPIVDWVNRFMTPYNPKENKSIGLAIGDAITQKWAIQNLSDFTLTDAKLKWNNAYSSSTLGHSKNDIYIGNIAPGDIAYPELSIDKTSYRGSGSDIGYYNLYYSKNNVDIPVKFPNSTKTVFLNYKFHDKKEVEPEIVGKVNSLYPRIARVGERQTFIIDGVNLPRTVALSIQDCDQGKVVWLNSRSARYSCIPRATGSKLLYAKMKSGGTSLTNSSVYRVQVSNIPEVDNKPSIRITTSGSSTSNNPKTSNFTLSVSATDDKGLKKVAYVLKKTSGGSVLKSGSKVVSGTSSSASFTIDVAGLSVGSYKIYVAASDTKNQASSYSYYYFQKKAVEVDNKPSIRITTSGSSTSNNPKTSNFTLSVSATDDKGLKKVAYVLKKTSGGSVLKSGSKVVSGTSSSASFTIDVAGLSVGSYKIYVAASDTKNQASSYSYYYFQKKAR